MFTGLIETVGTVRKLSVRGSGARLDVEARWPDGSPPHRGDSIAVDGVCLTAIEPTPSGFAADVSPETLRRTLLGDARPGLRVNLERALRLGDRLGGHLVQGHVDGIVHVLSIRPEGGFSSWRMTLPAEHAGEVALKGSVGLHGVSLTVADLGPDWFEVALIPETLDATTLGGLRSGARIHLETDVLAKYVARAVGRGGPSPLEEMFGGGGA